VVIRIRTSKKDRQHNDQQKKAKTIYKAQKIKDRATRIPIKLGVNSTG